MRSVFTVALTLAFAATAYAQESDPPRMLDASQPQPIERNLVQERQSKPEPPRVRTSEVTEPVQLRQAQQEQIEDRAAAQMPTRRGSFWWWVAVVVVAGVVLAVLL
jgi:hypothetical protein